jgi:predicted transcriptional regulator
VFFSVLENKELSWKAKGILIFMLQDGQGVTVNDLLERGKDGREGVLTALRELEAKGWIQKHTTRDEAGRIQSRMYIVSPEAVADGGEALGK